MKAQQHDREVGAVGNWAAMVMVIIRAFPAVGNPLRIQAPKLFR